jgi:hypothetical protein
MNDQAPQHFVAYHNVDVQERPLGRGVDGSFDTGKPKLPQKGDILWCFEGEGRPKQFRLVKRAVVSTRSGDGTARTTLGSCPICYSWHLRRSGYPIDFRPRASSNFFALCPQRDPRSTKRILPNIDVCIAQRRRAATAVGSENFQVRLVFFNTLLEDRLSINPASIRTAVDSN